MRVSFPQPTSCPPRTRKDSPGTAPEPSSVTPGEQGGGGGPDELARAEEPRCPLNRWRSLRRGMAHPGWNERAQGIPGKGPRARLLWFARDHHPQPGHSLFPLLHDTHLCQHQTSGEAMACDESTLPLHPTHPRVRFDASPRYRPTDTGASASLGPQATKAEAVGKNRNQTPPPSPQGFPEKTPATQPPPSHQGPTTTSPLRGPKVENAHRPRHQASPLPKPLLRRNAVPCPPCPIGTPPRRSFERKGKITQEK